MNTRTPDDSSSPFQLQNPRVVATVGSLADWELAGKIVSGTLGAPDWLEIRIDLLLEKSPDLPGSPSQLPLPFLLTVRHPSEGGRGPVSPGERIALYRRYWAQATAIDIELATAPEMADLIHEARDREIACILSYHHFQTTPTIAELESMTIRAAALGADLFKVATTTENAAELTTLITWLSAEKNFPVAAMGMGELGKISRPLLAQLGSRLNYGYLAEAVVPGQWTAGELRRVIDSLS